MPSPSRPTVRQLLDGEMLAGHEICAGASGLDNVVSGVQVAPLEGRVVPPGALLVVVAGAGTDVAVELLVRRVQSAAGAGIVLLDAPRLMLSTRRLADRSRVPLVLVRGPAEPLGLAWHLTRQVLDPAAAGGPLTARVIRRLSAPVASAEGVVDVLRTELRASIAVVTAEGTTLAGDGGLRLPGRRRAYATAEATEVPDEHLLCVPVQVEAQPSDVAEPDLWLLARIGPAHVAHVQSALDALRVGGVALAGWAARQRLDGERDARDRSLLLSEVMDGAGTLPRAAVERAVRAGWRLDGWHIGVYLRTAEDLAVVRRSPEVRQALADQRLLGPLVERSDGWAFWTTATREPPSAGYRELAERVRRALVAAGAEIDAVAGVGRPYAGPEGLAVSLREAREASLFAGRGSRRRRVEHIDELGVRRVLSDWHRSEAFRAYARSLLHPLLASGDGALLGTLGTYLELESSTASTAAALGLHRNTVALRVARIEELLGLTLTAPDERLVLQLACRVLQEGEG